ncbi:3-dehydroquinate synthase [Crateriforma conspicua]|uniref:3-dehydroquinate synthase n=1 Tax=Crateriforma conspicua TaxID=2527996 RepID=A0A5C5Y3M0_9PLAN|nr:3-dehydroquinate synthase [Crateriforma conspicua]
MPEESAVPASHSPEGHDEALDIAFAVPQTHRLRMTTDLAGPQFAVLEQLLSIDVVPGTSAKVLLWVDAEVAAAGNFPLRLSQRLSSSDAINLVAPVLEVQGGEAVKNSEVVLRQMLSQINDHDLDRRSTIIVVGGGAVLDAAGFAAAIAHRGIRLIRVPTTVLAQADSGVGVKNAINYFGKKNWIGTFAVPWAVINDASVLQTLPDRDFRSGFTEAVKVSLLKDAAGFEWLHHHADQIRARDSRSCRVAIRESCVHHLRHITQGGDPFEMLEARPLDFGHWSAHRLEPLTEYRLRHGEAVGIGVAIDCLYSSLVLGFPTQAAEKVIDCLRRLGVPLWDEAIDPVDRLFQGLEEFRQHLGGRLTITMLRDIGDPVDVHEIDTNAMAKAIQQLREMAGASAG